MSDIYNYELQKRIGQLNKSICCLTTVIETGDAEGGYNLEDHILLDASGVDTKSFAIGDIHSYSFTVNSGTVEVSYNGGAAVEYTTGLTVEYTVTNGVTIDIVCTSGTANLNWIYQ